MRAALRALAALGLVTAALAAPAQEQRPWQVEAGAGVESFSNDLADWYQLDLAVRHRDASRMLLEGTLRETRRRGLTDSEVGGGFALPVGGWTLSGALATSPTHRVLAKAAGRMDLARALDGGWVLSAGAGRSVFEGEGSSGGSGSSVTRLGVERYVGSLRFAAGYVRTRLDGGESDNGGVLAIDHYLAGERGRVGLVLASGRELENDPSLGGVLSTRVETFALVMAWPINADWTLLGNLTDSRQSDARVRSGPRTGDAVGSKYHRTGLRLGVRRDF